MTTVTSSGRRRLALATRRMFIGDGAVMSTNVGGLGADDELVHVEDRGRVEHRCRARRRRSPRSRSVMPLAVSVVPSIGSTAMSTSGPVPSPTRSPLKSIGASSFSPSPMTTTPFIETVWTRVRMALHRGAVGAVLVTAPDPAAGGHRRGFGDPHQLHGEVAVGGL